MGSIEPIQLVITETDLVAIGAISITVLGSKMTSTGGHDFGRQNGVTIRQAADAHQHNDYLDVRR